MQQIFGLYRVVGIGFVVEFEVDPWELRLRVIRDVVFESSRLVLHVDPVEWHGRTA